MLCEQTVVIHVVNNTKNKVWTLAMALATPNVTSLLPLSLYLSFCLSRLCSLSLGRSGLGVNPAAAVEDNCAKLYGAMRMRMGLRGGGERGGDGERRAGRGGG